MKKNIKKFFCFCLLGIIGIEAIATQYFTVDDLCYEYELTDEDHTCLFSWDMSARCYDKIQGHLTIPSSVSYGGETFRVVGIASSALFNCTSITSVTFLVLLRKLVSMHFADAQA